MRSNDRVEETLLVLLSVNEKTRANERVECYAFQAVERKTVLEVDTLVIYISSCSVLSFYHFEAVFDNSRAFARRQGESGRDISKEARGPFVE